jgi:hypothetical protein
MKIEEDGMGGMDRDMAADAVRAMEDGAVRGDVISGAEM